MVIYLITKTLGNLTNIIMAYKNYEEACIAKDEIQEKYRTKGYDSFVFTIESIPCL